MTVSQAPPTKLYTPPILTSQTALRPLERKHSATLRVSRSQSKEWASHPHYNPNHQGQCQSKKYSYQSFWHTIKLYLFEVRTLQHQSSLEITNQKSNNAIVITAQSNQSIKKAMKKLQTDSATPVPLRNCKRKSNNARPFERMNILWSQLKVINQSRNQRPSVKLRPLSFTLPQFLLHKQHSVPLRESIPQH